MVDISIVNGIRYFFWVTEYKANAKAMTLWWLRLCWENLENIWKTYGKWGFIVVLWEFMGFALWWTFTYLWKITISNWNTHYRWPFSIAIVELPEGKCVIFLLPKPGDSLWLGMAWVLVKWATECSVPRLDGPVLFLGWMAQLHDHARALVIKHDNKNPHWVSMAI